jgi:hypothetical protein
MSGERDCAFRKRRRSSETENSDSYMQQWRKRKRVPVSDTFKLSVLCFNSESFCLLISSQKNISPVFKYAILILHAEVYRSLLAFHLNTYVESP